MGRILSATATIITSVVLGAVAAGVMFVEFPAQMQVLQGYARWIEGQVGNVGLPVEYNVWVTFLLDDNTFLLMSFVIVMRIIMASFFALAGSAFGRG
jgi:hypothetical protein